MNYCILRTAKLSHLGNVAASIEHNFRTRDTPNADPERTPLNLTHGAISKEEALQKVNERLAIVNKVRKNAILVIEYLVTSSFNLETLEISNEYLDAGQRWISETHGAENVVFSTKHYDETTIHLAAMVVPIDPKRKLNASYFLDGRAKLSQMQSDFFRTVGEQYGLERGIEGSTARHTSIKKYYSIVNQPVPHPKTEIPQVSQPTHADILAESQGFETGHSRAVTATAAARRKREAEMKEQREAEHAKAKHAGLLTRQIEKEKNGISEWRAGGAVPRDLALELVLERLGCRRDASDKKTMIWRTPVGRITLKGTNFYADDLEIGDVGAIKLTKLLEDIDEDGALRLLIDKFGSDQVLAESLARVQEALKAKIEAAAAKPKPRFQLPQPSPKDWPRVRTYIVNTWKFSDRLVDDLHKAGRIFADKYANVVFILNGEAGVELHGTGERPFHGFHGERTRFELRNGDDKKVAFVETTVDAISLVELDFKGAVLSLNENLTSVARNWASQFLADGYQIFTAFDNNHAGDSLSQELGPDFERMRPSLKNWHQDLLARRSEDTVSEITPSAEEDQEHEAQRDQRPRER